MEWLGAMFKGIGDTFTAGASVDVAQKQARYNRDSLEVQRDQLAQMDDLQRMAWLQQNSQAEWNTVLYLGALLILALIVFLIFRK